MTMPLDQLVGLLLGLLVLSVLGGGLVVWAAIAATRMQGRAVLPFVPRRLVPWSGFQTGISMLLFVVVPMAAISMLHFAFGESSSDERGVPTDELLPLLLVDAGMKLALTAGVIGWLRSSGATRDDLGWRIRPVDIATGVCGFMALCLIVYPLQAVLQQFGKLRHPVERVLSEGIDPSTLLGMFVVAVIVAPLVEEFLFRVVLQGWLEKFWVEHQIAPAEPVVEGPMVLTVEADEALPVAATDNPYQPPRELATAEIATAEIAAPPPDAPAPEQPSTVLWLPIVATSVLFAALHAAAWPAPVPLFFLSLGLGYVYQRTHRLGPSVVLHATVNGVSVLMMAVQPLVNPGG